VSSQLSIFDDVAPPAARCTDPGTSHAAAAQAKELQNRHHRIILAALGQYGPMGKDAIGSRTQLTGHAVGKRMAELERVGLVFLTGRKVASAARRLEREWAKA
jgi:hypothetical protein